MKNEDIYNGISGIDAKYLSEAESYKPAKRKHLKIWIASAACLCLIVGSVTAVVATGAGTKIIELFTSREIKQDPDYKESGYEIGVEIENVPQKNLSQEMQNVGNTIRQQFEAYEEMQCEPDLSIYSSSGVYAGTWKAEFATRKEACEYVGLKQIKTPECDWSEQSNTLTVYGNKNGDILNLTIETYCTAGDIRIQFYTDIYTENHPKVKTVGTRTTEDVKYTESAFTAESGTNCHVISASALKSGYLTTDGYIVNDGVLYSLHLIFTQKDAAKAEKLLHEWADKL